MSVIQKIKDSKAYKTAAVTAAMVPVAACTALTCFATGEESSAATDFSSTLQTSFTSLQGDIFSYIGVVLPIALGVVAAFFGIKKAIGFFKKTAN